MNPIALLGIFLLFFIGLAMFCKVPVAYSIGSATLAVVVAAGMKSSTICTVAFSGQLPAAGRASVHLRRCHHATQRHCPCSG